MNKHASGASSMPSGWRRVQLGDVGDIVSGVTLGRKLNGRHVREVPYLRVANVKDGRLSLSDVYQIQATEEEIAKWRLRWGDLLLTEGGDADKLGRGTFWEDQLPECIHQNHIFRVRLDLEQFSPEFVAAQIGSPYGKAYFLAHAKQTTGIATINQRVLAAFPLVAPGLAEQKRIDRMLAEQMAAAARVHAAAVARLETAGALATTYLRSAFHGITPLAVGAAKDRPPSGWTWQRLMNLARLESGHTPSRGHPEWWGGTLPWIALPDIRELDGKVAFETREHTNDAGIANSAARVLPAKTVVLSRTASVGFVTVMGREMATSQDFVNWVCGPELDPYFLALLLRASRQYIRSLSSGAIHQTVYMPTVQAFEVCVPPLVGQKRITAALTERLAKADRMCKVVAEELATIEALPAALLRRAFSGEL